MTLEKDMSGKLANLAVVDELPDAIAVLQEALKMSKRLCYISFSKPAYSFTTFFTEHRIKPESVFIIDCITKSVLKRPPKQENCLFLPGPQDFSATLDSIRHTLVKERFDLIILDSLSTLLVYERALFVTQFFHSLVSLVKGLSIPLIAIVVNSDVDKGEFSTLGMLMDNVVHREK